jgi:hypothetical protein
MAFAAPKSLAEPFVYHAISLPTFWAGQKQPAMISFDWVHEKGRQQGLQNNQSHPDDFLNVFRSA